MKKIILTAILIVGATVVSWTQKVITQKVDVKDKNVEMKFDFADTIRVEAWNKNIFELEVDVNIDDNRFNDYYKLNVNENAGKVELVEKVDFEGIRKARETKTNSNFSREIIYRLKVPASLEFDLKTISGRVVLVGMQGRMSVNTISGFIDYAIPASTKASINLSTVTGDVYSDVKFDNKVSKEFALAGTKCDLTLNGGTLPVWLKTISGNIYLRQSKTVN